MNILEACVPIWYPGQSLATLGPASPLFWHALIETKKLVYSDTYANNADPDVVSVPVALLTSKTYAASQCKKVDPSHAGPTVKPSFDSAPAATAAGNIGGDTIYLTTADRWGNMVSWINSNFAGFGSGITVPKYGFILHNRGGLFTLDPNSPNVIAPHKRPYNTLSAVFATQNGNPLLTTGQHGGDQQGMGNMQVLVNILDLGANMQAAGDMARFTHAQVANTLQLESQLFSLVGPQLIGMGHKASSAGGGIAGGYQGIMFVPNPEGGRISTCNSNHDESDRDAECGVNGFYRAGSNLREDGDSIGW
jgi:gamma-glutamyltranspeptidase/glutathione hydrolase